jgi:peptidoglycan/LPS O-acetylase OafA/YrhL
MATRERIDQFDGLRALAFLGVFLHHGMKVPLLWMGVDLFFVLSGFLITRNLLVLREQATTRSAFAVFFYRRLLRIIPPYYAALTLVLVITPIESDRIPWFYAFASNVHDSIHGPIEGSLSSFWSIAVEEQFYIVWPWLVLFVPRRILPVTFVGFIVIATGARYAFGSVGFDAVYRLTICRMDLLAAGALLALIDLRDPDWFERQRGRLLTCGVLAVGLFVVLSISTRSFRTSMNHPLFNIVGFALSAVFFTAVLAYVRSGKGWATAALRHRVLVYIGKISYMSYLLHELALNLAGRLELPRAPTAAIGLTLTLGLASVSWYVLEQPLQRLRRVVVPRPRPRTFATDALGIENRG